MSFETTTRTIAGRAIRTCSSCGALIVWFKTEAGRPHPVNATSVQAADMNLDLQTKSHPQGKHISHFATCPNADKHRKPR
jgi:hypothetical protein